MRLPCSERWLAASNATIGMIKVNMPKGKRKTEIKLLKPFEDKSQTKGV